MRAGRGGGRRAGRAGRADPIGGPAGACFADLKFKKEIWVQFAATIALALEFALAADIARTAIAPTWNDIGQLGAIAAIRTFLNLFLERDIEAFTRAKPVTPLLDRMRPPPRAGGGPPSAP